MSRRPAALAFLVAMTVSACRRDMPHLADAPRLAYGVKPAVVRVSALATAEFRYPAEAIDDVASGLGITARNVPAGTGVVETGAGGSGSGFIIRADGYILTSGHVVAPTRDIASLERALRRNGAIAALVKHFPIDQLRSSQRDSSLGPFVDALAKVGVIEKMRIVDQVVLSDGETMPFTVRGYSPALSERGADLALLHVEHQNLPALPLGDSATVSVGDSIWAAGYPSVASSSDDVIGGWLSRDTDLEATFSAGAITAIRRDVAGHEVLQSNVAIYPGNSGGPVVNHRGEVIGIAGWGPPTAEQIKFLVPISVARPFVAKAGIRPVVDGEFNRSYGAALEAASRGDWPEARGDLDVAAGLFPNSPDLARFGVDVDRALLVPGWWQLHRTAVLLIGVLLVGLAAITAVAILRRAHVRGLEQDAESDFATVPPAPRDATGAAAPRLLGKFTILNGSRAGERLGLGGTGIRIGREQAICEIVLENPKISRLHAEVVCMDGKVLLIDRNSANGTYVNDQKIDRRELRNGDIIYFGGRNAIAVEFHV